MPNSIVRVPGGTVLGFACMIQLTDGTRQIVWSDEIDGATFEFLQDVISLESVDEVYEIKTANPRYVATIQGTRFQITRGPQSVGEVMELKNKRPEQKKLEDKA